MDDHGIRDGPQLDPLDMPTHIRRSVKRKPLFRVNSDGSFAWMNP